MIGLKKISDFFKDFFNQPQLAGTFPRLEPAKCLCIVFWLVHGIDYLFSDWPEKTNGDLLALISRA